jgi:AraC-like DNA-binding protein
MSKKLDLVKDWPTQAERAHHKVNELATSLGVSVRELERYAKDYFQVPIGVYLRALQINKAIDKLLQGQRAKEVAFDLHFGSPSQFSREFKRYTGYTPKEIVVRKKLRNGRV